MKASELRIGNYLQDKALDKWFSVTSQLIFDYDRLQLQNHVKPIPLTEEWLLKFRFSIIKSIYNDNIYFHEIRPELEIRLIGEEYDLGIETEWLSEIKHVHQLQNLYFALTGEELTIKQ